MKIGLAMVVLAVTASTTHADQKIRGMTPGFQKELSACEVEVRGLARIVEGAKGLNDATLAADVGTLETANTTVTAWCTAVGDMVKFLTDNAAAAYKSVERDIDTRDNTVRKLRKDAKKALADLSPVTRKLIPRLKRTPAPAEPTKVAAPTAFPSKRKVVLPALGGTWMVSGSSTTDTATHTDKQGTATITSRPFDKASCEQQRKAFAERSDSPAAELQVSPEAEKLGVAWSARTATRKPVHALLAMCVEKGMGGVLVTADYTPPDRKVHDADLTKLMIAMLAAQLETK